MGTMVAMKSPILPCAIILALSFGALSIVLADSATWNLDPASGDWNTATNWTPASVPNRPGDIATFDASTTAAVSLSKRTVVNEIVFNPGASAYTVTATTRSKLTLSGVGITNNSGVTQNFATTSFEGDQSLDVILFTGYASAGEDTVFTNNDGIGSLSGVGSTTFREYSSAGHATIINGGGTASGRTGGFTGFYDHATCADSTIIVNGGEVPGAGGAYLFITGNAGNATIIVNNGAGYGGYLSFGDEALGGTARIEVFGNGVVNQSNDYDGVSVGSIEGDGTIDLGDFTMSVGTNNLSTVFSGLIEDGASEENGGTLRKIGTGVLTLSGANTYTNGTIVEAGGLAVNNRTGSGTSTGVVNVHGGTLGGKGIITGPTVIGTGIGTGAFLAPAVGTGTRATLTIKSGLTFNSDATYTYTYRAKSNTAVTDLVVANFVTIYSGATLDFDGTINGRLTPGLVFTVISNTSRYRIIGTFSNLPDGSTVVLAGNTFQANYRGGDGNDLTLTVVP